MDHPLAGALAKVIRAEEHLAELEREIGAYIEREPYFAASELQEKPLGYKVTVHERESPPPVIAVLVGEVAQQLRASLDYLACELVIAHGGRPNLSTEFPILRPPLRHVTGGQVVIDAPTQPRKAPTIRTASGGVSDYASAVIDSLQPHNRPESNTCLWPNIDRLGLVPYGARTGSDYVMFDIYGRSPLHVLRQLSNIDKHRHLHVVTGYVGMVVVSWREAEPGEGVPGSRHVVTEGAFHDGAQIGFVPINPADRDREVIVHGKGRPEVAIEEPEVAPALCPCDLVLRKVLDFVRLHVFSQLAGEIR